MDREYSFTWSQGEHWTNADNKWKNSRESQHQQHHHRQDSNVELKPSSSSSTANATGNANNGNAVGTVYSLSESASAMFAEYNATWDELESRLKTTNLKGGLQ